MLCILRKIHSSVVTTSRLMLCGEVVSVPEMCAKQVNTLCEQKLEFFNLEPSGT